MADAFGSVGTSGATSTSSTEYPVDIKKIIKGVQGQIGGLNTGQATAQNLSTFLNNPLSSELFEGTIGTLLEALRPSEEAAREALANQFRIAGGGQGGALQSGSFAKEAARNEQNILQNRSNVVAQRASETFRNLLSGLGLGLQTEEAMATPARLGIGLLGAIRPTGSSETRSGAATSGWENIPPSLGLATPTTGGTPGSSAPQSAYYGSGNPSNYGGAYLGPNYDPLERYYDDLRSQEYQRMLSAAADTASRPVPGGNTGVNQHTYSERPLGPVNPEEFMGMLGG